MKLLMIKRKTILKIILLFIFIIIVTRFTTAFGMQNYYKLDFSTGLVTATTLNVRSGPRNQFSSNRKNIQKSIYTCVCWNRKLVYSTGRRRLYRSSK